MDITIIGAGPYGLSLAAHLNDRADYRIFGRPMASWREQMPEDMDLKSEGFATSLSDPDGAYQLRTFCAEQNEPYADLYLPITIKRFINYGMAFQSRFVPSLDETYVASVTRDGKDFTVRLVNGETFTTKKVLVAAGISHFAYTPQLFAGPSDLISHTSDHSDLSKFKDKSVIVVGAGASAIDTAVLLSDAGAHVTVSTRRSAIPFIEAPKPRTKVDEIVAPMTGLGPGFRTWMYVSFPGGFYNLPDKIRFHIARTHLGPGPAYFMRDRYQQASIDTLFNATPIRVSYGNRVEVTYSLKGDGARTVAADHVIAATGYRVDLRRLSFLSELLDEIEMVQNTPMLSKGFESSVRGLYFVGAAATNSFGPVERFVYGTDYTCRTLMRDLLGRRRIKRLANQRQPLAKAA